MRGVSCKQFVCEAYRNKVILILNLENPQFSRYRNDLERAYEDYLTLASPVAMDEIGLDKGVIVTLEDEEEIVSGGKVIQVVPAYKYLLGGS